MSTSATIISAFGTKHADYYFEKCWQCINPIEIIDIECVLGHEHVANFFTLALINPPY